MLTGLTDSLISLIVPAVITAVGVTGTVKKVDVFASLTDGIQEGLKIIYRIFPSLVALITAVYMMRASGLMDFMNDLLSPLMGFLGIPAETSSLVILRPVSGSGALAVGSELIREYGADSIIGRTAAVMLGSTETTFYVIAVYFGSLGVKRTRYAVPAALTADLVGFITAALSVRLIWG